MASQKQMEGTRKGDSNTKVTHFYKGGCKRTMSLQANHYTQIKHDLQILQIHQSRVGCSLKRTHYRRHLVPPGKQVAYQLPRTQGSLSSLTRVLQRLETY